MLICVCVSHLDKDSNTINIKFLELNVLLHPKNNNYLLLILKIAIEVEI